MIVSASRRRARAGDHAAPVNAPGVTVTTAGACPSVDSPSWSALPGYWSWTSRASVVRPVPGGPMMVMSPVAGTLQVPSAPVPSTTSRPFSLAEPVRSSRPMVTFATSRTRIGTPARVATRLVEVPS